MDEVLLFLDTVKKNIKECKLVISSDNIDELSSTYSLSSKIIRNMIKKLNLDYFIDSIYTDYSDYKLYVFENTYELVDFHGDKNNVRIQLKLNYIVDCNTIIVEIC